MDGSGSNEWSRQSRANAKQWGGYNSVQSLTWAIENRLWPTPRAYSHSPGISAPGLTPLDIQAREMYRDDPKHARYWPTPQADQGRDRVEASKIVDGRLVRSSGQDFSLPLGLKVITEEQDVSPQPLKRLSAAWVAELMGFPRDWTLLAPEKSSALGKRPASSRKSKTAPRG